MRSRRIIISEGLPKTGQTTSYATGDDGDIEAGWFRKLLNSQNLQRFIYGANPHMEIGSCRYYWKMNDDEANDDVDEEVQGNQGTLLNGVGSNNTEDNTVTGKIDKALFLAGNHQINLDSEISLSGRWSVAMWVRADHSDYAGVIGDTNTNCRIELGDDNLRVRFYNTAAAFVTWTTAAGYFQDTWRHVVLVSDGVTVTLYLNGVSQGARTITPDWTIDNFGYVDGVDFWDGYIDEVMVFYKTLTVGEVNAIYNGGSGTDYTWASEELFVIDRATGLYWPTDAGDSGWITGTPGTGWSTGISSANGLTFAGFSDWRMPNIKELISVVRYEPNPPEFPADVFLAAASVEPWTSTTYSPDDTQAYYLQGGTLITDMKMSAKKTPCVRGGL